MRQLLLTAAVLAGGLFLFSEEASARGPSTYSGYVQQRLQSHGSLYDRHPSFKYGSRYGHRYGHRYDCYYGGPRYRWHDTSHYDYQPGGYYRHRNHYRYVPGHYDFHREGHYDRIR